MNLLFRFSRAEVIAGAAARADCPDCQAPGAPRIRAPRWALHWSTGIFSHGGNAVAAGPRSGRIAGAIALAAISLAAAGCGGGGHAASAGHSSAAPVSGSGGVAVSKAADNPCVLVSTAQASGILGAAAQQSLGSVGTYPGCTYDAGSQNVIVALSPVAYSASIANGLMHAQPVTSLGHQATCGEFAATTFTVMGAVDAGHTLEVSGPSCDVVVKFAADAYARL